MRLWHVDLIPVLPRQQLLGQWRELNSIYKKQDKHILINFLYDYLKDDLLNYSYRVIKEMKKRGYNINLETFYKYFFNYEGNEKYFYWCYFNNNILPFKKKMNRRYLIQCYYNLQEKYDCGGISQDEWQRIYDKFKYLERD